MLSLLATLFIGFWVLLFAALPLILAIRYLYWGPYVINRARKQAERILAGEIVLPAQLQETARVLSTSRNSYNKELMAKLVQLL